MPNPAALVLDHMATGNIFWLVSYPKSGNTWLRILLANYFRGGAETVDINDLFDFPLAASRPLFDEHSGLEASDLTHDEIERYRPRVYEEMSRCQRGPRFLKTHDTYHTTPSGDPLFPASATAGVVYLVRNPLDVAVSFAHHSRVSFDEIIETMACEETSWFAEPQKLGAQLRQHLSSWSGHVRSWVDDSDLRLCLLRYEDMLVDPIGTFTECLAFIGESPSHSEVESAVLRSGFDRLRTLELTSGFGEKPAGVGTFFRKGRAGSWREELTKTQAGRIADNHREMMHRIGYKVEELLPVEAERQETVREEPLPGNSSEGSDGL